MTDTLPSWAFRIAKNYALLNPHQEEFLRDDIEKAIAATYQQGKQDGQREMKERAAKMADAKLREYEDCDGPRQSVVASIRALGGPDAG